MKITIIGCGQMGGAYAERLSVHHQLFLYDHHHEKVEALHKKGHGTPCTDITYDLTHSDFVILAMKPQALIEAAREIQWKPITGQIIISILAGVTLDKLKKHFPGHHIIRMMPNLAILYGQGQIGVVVDIPLQEKEKNHLIELSKPLGILYWLEEEMMDSFTALAGSGPAFFYAILEAIVEAGTAMGFSEREGKEIATQMMKSSLDLLEKSKESTQALISRIASPGGTTEAGLKKYEELHLFNAIPQIFLAAYERAKTL